MRRDETRLDETGRDETGRRWAKRRKGSGETKKGNEFYFRGRGADT